MKKEDIKLICIWEEESETYTVFPSGISGVVVQVKDLEDAPKQLSKSIEALFVYSLRENNIHVYNWKKPK